MKLFSKNGKKVLKMSQQEWSGIGEKVGWLEKSAQEKPAVPQAESPKQIEDLTGKLQCRSCLYVGEETEFKDETNFLSGCPECGSRYVGVPGNG